MYINNIENHIVYIMYIDNATASLVFEFFAYFILIFGLIITEDQVFTWDKNWQQMHTTLF